MPGMIILFCSLILLGFSQSSIFQSKDLIVFVGELIIPRTLKKLEMVNNKLAHANRAYKMLIETGKMLALFQHKQTGIICTETYADKRNDGKTLLHIAAIEDQPRAIDILILCGAKVDPRDHNLQTPLMLASLNFNVDSVAELLSHDADPNLNDINGNAAIHIAAHFNQFLIINILINYGAEVHLRNRCSQTPLLIAIIAKSVESVEMLLCNDSRFRRKDFEMLLNCGALIDEEVSQHIINYKDGKGNKIIHSAAFYDHVDVIKILLKHGARVDDTNNILQTPLMFACKQGNVDSVKFLLNNGADATRKDIEKHTALHYAVSNLKLLCDSLFLPSDPYLKNYNKDSFLRYAYRSKYKKCIAHLEYNVRKKWLYGNVRRLAIPYLLIIQVIFFAYYVYSEFFPSKK